MLRNSAASGLKTTISARTGIDDDGASWSA